MAQERECKRIRSIPASFAEEQASWRVHASELLDLRRGIHQSLNPEVDDEPESDDEFARGDQLSFREQLMEELANLFRNQSPSVKVNAAPKTSIALAKDHYSYHRNEKKDCVVCSGNDGLRKRTHSFCTGCNVNVCEGDCFAAYHS